ncbi:MAG: hypothetical protein IKI95_03310 [Clostridia bacterium]|nr:hypothetical protein [Clostridia bacterium]
MFYNVDLKKIQTNADCLVCPHFDKKKKKCNGVGRSCFEFDMKTRTIIDPITKLPIKVDIKK